MNIPGAKTRRTTVIAACAALVLSDWNVVQADDILWINSSGGAFSDALNWEPVIVAYSFFWLWWLWQQLPIMPTTISNITN